MMGEVAVREMLRAFGTLKTFIPIPLQVGSSSSIALILRLAGFVLLLDAVLLTSWRWKANLL